MKMGFPMFGVLVALAFLSVCAGEPTTPTFRAVQIDNNIEIGYGLAIADVDGDGKSDILLADKRQIVWYRNPEWQKHLMAEDLTPRDNVCIAAADLDGDGKAEVAVGAEWNPSDTINSGAVFFLNPPEDRTAKWEPIRLHHEPTVHRMRWVLTVPGSRELVVLPLHGRGNKEGQGAGVRILSYTRPLDIRKPWITEEVDGSLHLTHNFDPVQWDGDAADELLVGAREGVFLFDRRDANWVKSQLTGPPPGETDFPGAGEVRAGKSQEDARFFATIEPMHGNQVCVYTPPDPASDHRRWQRQVIDNSLVDGHALVIGDFTKAGSGQVIAGWRAMNKPEAGVGIRWYAQGRAGEWRRVTVDDGGMACEDLAAADLNGDGRLDLVASGRGTRNVKIYFNQTPARPDSRTAGQR